MALSAALWLLQVRFTGVSAGLFGAVLDIRCCVVAEVRRCTCQQYNRHGLHAINFVFRPAKPVQELCDSRM